MPLFMIFAVVDNIVDKLFLNIYFFILSTGHLTAIHFFYIARLLQKNNAQLSILETMTILQYPSIMFADNYAVRIPCYGSSSFKRITGVGLYISEHRRSSADCGRVPHNWPVCQLQSSRLSWWSKIFLCRLLQRSQAWTNFDYTFLIFIFNTPH